MSNATSDFDTGPIYQADGSVNGAYLIKNAELLYQNSEYHLAENIYNTLSHSAQFKVFGLEGLARCYEATDRKFLALKAHLALGELHLRETRIPEAKRHFQHVIKKDPAHAQAIAKLGSCLLAENQPWMAHDHFALSLDLDIGQPEVMNDLLKAARKIKSYATAAQLLEEHLKTVPLTEFLIRELADLQNRLGKTAESKKTLTRLLGLRSR